MLVVQNISSLLYNSWDENHHDVYHPEYGSKAITLYKELVEKRPELKRLIDLYVTSNTHAEGEYAIEKSRKHYGIKVSSEFYNYTSIWAKNCVYTEIKYNLHRKYKLFTEKYFSL
jgi:hypothetical protein